MTNSIFSTSSVSPAIFLIFTQKSSGHKQSSAPFHRGRPSKRSKRIAPKGRKRIARANGPGLESIRQSALKGRNQRISRPYRASCSVGVFFPGALPLALFLGPFRAWTEMAVDFRPGQALGQPAGVLGKAQQGGRGFPCFAAIRRRSDPEPAPRPRTCG